MEIKFVFIRPDGEEIRLSISEAAVLYEEIRLFHNRLRQGGSSAVDRHHIKYSDLKELENDKGMLKCGDSKCSNILSQR